MRRLLITPFLLVSTWVVAEEPNPFMSAQDRQEKIEEENKREQERLQKMVEDAVKDIKKEMSKQKSAQEKEEGNANAVEKDGRREKMPAGSQAASFPSDFAIAGIKGNHILMRQMDNKSMIVTSGEIFWDKGEAYEASIVGNESVSIMRISDKEVVFYGGVGSVFTPTENTIETTTRASSRNNGGA